MNVTIKKAEVEKWNAIMSQHGSGTDEVLKTFTFKFPDGYQADIKICDGDYPWIDPVLFDEKGHEVAALLCDDGLISAYPFDDKHNGLLGVYPFDDKHILVIEEEAA
jgi:hypothetical protein